MTGHESELGTALPAESCELWQYEWAEGELCSVALAVRSPQGAAMTCYYVGKKKKPALLSVHTLAQVGQQEMANTPYWANTPCWQVCRQLVFLSAVRVLLGSCQKSSPGLLWLSSIKVWSSVWC